MIKAPSKIVYIYESDTWTYERYELILLSITCESSHLDPRHLQKPLIIACGCERVKAVFKIVADSIQFFFKQNKA